MRALEIEASQGLDRFRLWAEFVALYFGTPVAFFLIADWVPGIAVLLGIAVACWVWLRGRGASREMPVCGSRRCNWLLLAGTAFALSVGILWFAPELFLWLPRNDWRNWSLMLLLYPVLSVFPQELIFRQFFFERYGALFPRVGARMVASAVVFSFAHVIYRNGLALALTLPAGYWFARTYAESRSLRRVCLEHTVYGVLAFTVGLGPFFGFEGPHAPAVMAASRGGDPVVRRQCEEQVRSAPPALFRAGEPPEPQLLIPLAKRMGPG